MKLDDEAVERVARAICGVDPWDACLIEATAALRAMTPGSRWIDAEGREMVAAEVESSIRHLKRGSAYDVLGDGEVQMSDPPGFFPDGTRGRVLREGDKLVVYRCATSGKLWLRDRAEMEDGRFAAAAPGGDNPDLQAQRESFARHNIATGDERLD